MAELQVRVAHSLDDVYVRQITPDFSKVTHECPVGWYWNDFEQYGSGMRFLNITVPANAVLSSVILRMTCKNAYSGTGVLSKFRFEVVADPTRIADLADFNNRSKGTKVDWDIDAAWDVDSEHDSPNLAAIFQDILDLGGWASGNAVQIFWEDDGSPHNFETLRNGWSFDGAEAKAPLLIITYTVPVSPPVAAFSGTPLSGNAPLTVQFTDESTNEPTSWLWDFGDEESSEDQSPEHIYENPGTYTVKLTATNEGGSDDEEKIDYVVVSEPAPPPTPPAADINPNAFSGYHCFIEQYQKRRIAGKIPYKRPEGTLYRDSP